MLKGNWISFDGCEAPVAFRHFCCAKPERAQISICGLGFFELYINGSKVSGDVLTPVWSDYEPRLDRNMLYPVRDEFTHRIYYREYDVTFCLIDGENELKIMLGNGWYNQHERNVEGDFWYGAPKLCFSLTIHCENGGRLEVVSDEKVRWSPGQIIYNNIYFGETQDFRVQAAPERKALLCAAPRAELVLQTCPPDRVMMLIHPVLIHEDGNRCIYDAGQNLSGWACFTQIAGCGEKTVVRYAEETGGKFLDFASAGGEEQIQKDEYISNGKLNFCHPHFTWHGFRYFEITGPASDVEVAFVHSEAAVTSAFESSSGALNWLYRSYLYTQLSNMHCGVVSDCPHRERLGYTGDGQLTCDTAMLLIRSSRGLYEKWMQDIADCQDKTSGHVQHTAPFYGGGGGPGGWGCAVVVVPYFYYKHFGDRQVLERYFPNMLKWVSYMESRSENHLVVREEEGGWCLGDWCTPGEVRISEAFVNTYFLVKALGFMAEIAAWLGLSCKALAEKQERIKQALRETFYDERTNSYCGGVQGANAFALDIGLGNAKMLADMANYYDALGEFDTGIFGTDVVLRTLFEGGYTDVAYRLLTSEKKNSFGYQRSCGATTLWEDWDGNNSHNHPMFGACTGYLFRYILGIRDEADELVIMPQIPADASFKFAKGSLKTKFGFVEVSFQKTEGGTEFAVYAEKGGNFRFAGQQSAILPGERRIINILDKSR